MPNQAGLPPVQIWPRPFNTDSPNSPIRRPLSPVARVVKLVAKKADRYNKLISEGRGCVADHRRWKAALKRAVVEGRLEEYMALETQIKLSGLPRRARRKMLKKNVKLCLREKEWRSL